MTARLVYAAPAPIGALTLVESGEALCELRFGDTGDEPTAETPLLCRAREQLNEYFCGRRNAFELPLRPVGTPFQEACWRALLSIPYGKTVTYGEQAALIGKPKACRAVGMANHYNPIPIIIPCHRVVGVGGRLTGYGGGLPVKEYLLALERDGKDGGKHG